MTYTTPGVYVDKVSGLPPTVAGVATAIPAFIGYTQQATQETAGDLTLKPLRVTSMVEYEKYFGIADPEQSIKVAITTATDGSINAVATLAENERSQHRMWYALRMYFDNGGGPCYICSVANYKALDLTELEKGLAAVANEEEPTLLVFPEAQCLAAIADCQSLYDQALQQCAALQNRFLIMDVHGGAVSLNDATADMGAAVKNFRDSGTPANNLAYGAAYAPNLATSLRFAYAGDKTDVAVGATTVKLDVLEASDSRSYNLAIGAINKLVCKLPPAGAMAGIYAAVDSAHGVWKAPANISVSDAIQPTIAIDASTQDTMNVDSTGKSVNAIRAFTGQGTLVWGARTLAGNDNEWRYVNVRRFCIFAGESIRRATRQFALEPNDANAWVKVQGMIENFLTPLWRQGALMGVKTSEAFWVQVGLGSTMTVQDTQAGRMVVVVGLAPVQPAEFIVLRFVQTMPVS